MKRYAAYAVPRYTSFPTAADFMPMEADTTARWLRQIGPDEGVSLYIHVPYCKQICHYCGCHSKLAVRDTVVDSFHRSLLNEIATVGQVVTTHPKLTHLHWGGGTPSILNSEQFLEIRDALSAVFQFPDTMEHAIELDPRTVTPELVKTLAAIGVNRASLGVQDINEDVQQAIGRIQPIEMVVESAELLRVEGIDRINFDLIYGLPLQTVDSLRRTCETVSKLQPSRVACFGYAHLPERRANQRLIDESLLPDSEERFAQSRVVADCFTALGYEAIGIDHYALPDDPMAIAAQNRTLNRNFQGYTTDRSQILIGLGPSSISQYPGGYAQNIADVTRYRKCVDAGLIPTVRGYTIRDSDRLRSAIINALMCSFEVDLDKVAPGVEFADELALLRPLVADGLVEVKGSVIRSTEMGKPLIRLVAAAFDEFRRDTVHSFSFAV
ncbi:oxygen-independent coproporphyrinogen III oxidase [Brucellaceae bacterium D45D]